MSQDSYGRMITPRGGSPPTSFRSEDMMRAVNLPQSNCFTESQMRANVRQRPLRSKTGPQVGPRLPRNRMTSLANMDNSKMPFRTNSATTLQYPKPNSPPRRVPPLTTSIGQTAGTKELDRFDSGLGLERPSKPKSRKSSFPGLKSRCISDSDSEDELLDCVHSVVKPNNESLMRPVSPMTTIAAVYQPRQATLPTDMLQRQDSAISDQQMDTLQSPVGGETFDPETYKKHLDDIQAKALEWSRLQEGLAMLLPNSDGDTGFHHAVIYTKPNVLSRLLELVGKYPQLQSYINDQNSMYQTCLHLAVHLQQIDTMRMLLNAGAAIHLQDHKGNTPLHIACRHKNTRCLDVLLSAIHHRTLSQLAEIRNFEGHSCAHIAVHAENNEALLKLRGAGVDVDMKDYSSGKTALHIAVEKGSFQLTQILIQSCSADFNKPMYSGCTPLHIAAGRGHVEIVAYLVSLGADPYAVTDEGDMPCDVVTNEYLRTFLEAVTGIC